MTSRRRQLEQRLGKIPNVVVEPSQLGGEPAFWSHGREIMHFHDDDVVDLRLTRGEIRDRRADLRADPRVELRASTSSDWVEIHFSSPADVEFVVDLARVAAAANDRR
jgi:hypothetical protein